MSTEKPVAAIIHLGRACALGEAARVRSWRTVLEGAGYAVVDVPLRSVASIPSLSLRKVVDALTGRGVPETLSWSSRRLRRHLRATGADLEVFVTLRAFDRRLAQQKEAATVLDYVDRLSVSYRDRARHRNPIAALLLRVLAATHWRAERAGHDVVLRAAAGLSDAQALGACWIPNVIADEGADLPAPDHDVVFLGNLAYEPNVAALALLASSMDIISRTAPATTVLIGGANAGGEVKRVCDEKGWDLVEGFDNPVSFAARGRVAVAPMTIAAGIQNKILEAAAAGRPQVITSIAAAGLDTPPPGIVADGPDEFATAIVAVLTNPSRYGGAREWLDQTFSPSVWAQRLLDAMGGRTSDEIGGLVGDDLRRRQTY